jgi:hypothetical protein
MIPTIGLLDSINEPKLGNKYQEINVKYGCNMFDTLINISVDSRKVVLTFLKSEICIVKYVNSFRFFKNK